MTKTKKNKNTKVNDYNIGRNFPFKYNWSEKQFFIYACFVDDLQQFYKDWVEQGKKSGRIQLFDIRIDGRLEHKYWKPSKICCETGEELTKENIDVKVGYWLPNLWKPIRKDLKQDAIKFESLECQKIDCSCNDCKHLYRAKKLCNKFNKKVNLYANLCHPQNQKCFEHIRL